jgi:hypothetical protein
MKIVLKFKESESSNVASYNLYAVESGEELTVDSASFTYDLGKPESDEDGFISVVLNDISELNDLEGEYDFGVSAIDEDGNESDLLTEDLEGVDLDSFSPAAPTEGSIEYDEE